MNKKNGFSINLGGLELGDTSLMDSDIFETPIESVEIKKEKEIVRPRLIEKAKEVTKSEIIKKFAQIGEHEVSIETGDMGLLCSDEDFDDSFDDLLKADSEVQVQKILDEATEEEWFDENADFGFDSAEDECIQVGENNELTNEGGNLSIQEEADETFSLDSIENFEYTDETEDETKSNDEIKFRPEANNPVKEEFDNEIDGINFEDEGEEPSSESLADELDGISFEDEGESFEGESLDSAIDNIGFEDSDEDVPEKSDESNEDEEESFSLDDIDNMEISEETEEVDIGVVQESKDSADIKIKESNEDIIEEDDDSFSLDDIDSIDVENTVENVNNEEQSLDLDSISFSDLQEDEQSDDDLLGQFDDGTSAEVIEEDTITKANRTVKDTSTVGVEETKSKNDTSGDGHDIKEIDSMQEIRADIADIKRIIQSGGRAEASNRASNVREDKNREFRENSKSPDPKAEIERYSSMTIDSLYKEVKEFMIQNGVKRSPVALDILNKKFGDKNIVRLVRTSYLIILGKGVTIGR